MAREIKFLGKIAAGAHVPEQQVDQVKNHSANNEKADVQPQKPSGLILLNRGASQARKPRGVFSSIFPEAP
ncbi:MAG: hypothetical protein CMH76_05175 [Nitrospinae bacterium]|nr:hypothetical protein [Nitrospinota bacterium]